MDTCRCCLISIVDVANLIELSATMTVGNGNICMSNNEVLNISQCLHLCTNIPMDLDNNPKIPQLICQECFCELKVSFEFRAKCEQAYIILCDRLKLDADEEQQEQPTLLDNTAINDDCEAIQEYHIDESMEYVDGAVIIEVLENNSIVDEAEELELEIVKELFDENNSQQQQTVEDPEKKLILIKNEPMTEDSKVTEILSNNIHEQNVTEIVQTYLFECETCTKGFKNKTSLKRHMNVTHSGKTSHLCNICGELFLHESSLKIHILSHQRDGTYKCDHCDNTYLTQKLLQNHLVTHKEKKLDAKFLCSTCGKGFTTNQRLQIHTYTHTGERNYGCDICDKAFATEFRLRSHQRTHTGERPYHCTECGLTFAQGNALKCHKRIHTGEKPYACKFCDKRFSQNTILKTHMTLHTGKTVKCPDCDKKFSRASYLILHRREHTGEKPYACTKCDNRYRQKSHLDRHIDTHLGVKHKCNICNKEYSKQWSLKMHMFTHSDVKPFKCEICLQSFIRKDKYRSHLKVQHGQTLGKDKVHHQNLIMINDVKSVNFQCDKNNDKKSNQKRIVTTKAATSIKIISDSGTDDIPL